MESFLLGSGLLICFVVWRAWKATALDECRDKLFDIRDGARQYFLSKGYALDDRVYVAFRELMNSHIRYTRRLTFPGFLATTMAVRSNKEFLDHVRTEINRKLASGNPEIDAYIEESRKKATDALMQYIGETSAFIIFVMVVTLPFFAARFFFKSLSRWMDVQNRLMADGARALLVIFANGCKALFRIAPIAGLIIAMPAKAGIIDKSMTGMSMLEEYSYEVSSTN